MRRRGSDRSDPFDDLPKGDGVEAFDPPDGGGVDDDFFGEREPIELEDLSLEEQAAYIIGHLPQSDIMINGLLKKEYGIADKLTQKAFLIALLPYAIGCVQSELEDKIDVLAQKILEDEKKIERDDKRRKKEVEAPTEERAGKREAGELEVEAKTEERAGEREAEEPEVEAQTERRDVNQSVAVRLKQVEYGLSGEERKTIASNVAAWKAEIGTLEEQISKCGLATHRDKVISMILRLLGALEENSNKKKRDKKSSVEEIKLDDLNDRFYLARAYLGNEWPLPADFLNFTTPREQIKNMDIKDQAKIIQIIDESKQALRNKKTKSRIFKYGVPAFLALGVSAAVDNLLEYGSSSPEAEELSRLFLAILVGAGFTVSGVLAAWLLSQRRKEEEEPVRPETDEIQIIEANEDRVEGEEHEAPEAIDDIAATGFSPSDGSVDVVDGSAREEGAYARDIYPGERDQTPVDVWTDGVTRLYRRADFLAGMLPQEILSGDSARGIVDSSLGHIPMFDRSKRKELRAAESALMSVIDGTVFEAAPTPEVKHEGCDFSAIEAVIASLKSHRSYLGYKRHTDSDPLGVYQKEAMILLYLGAIKFSELVDFIESGKPMKFLKKFSRSTVCHRHKDETERNRHYKDSHEARKIAFGAKILGKTQAPFDRYVHLKPLPPEVTIVEKKKKKSDPKAKPKKDETEKK